MAIAGIAPDSKQPTEQVENMEQEQKLIKEALISAYDKNISTRLKAELCSYDANSYNYAKDGSKSKSSIFSILFLQSLIYCAATPRRSKEIPTLASNVYYLSFLLLLSFQLFSSNEFTGHDVMKAEQWCTSWWHQFKVLLQRGLRERRFEAFNRLRIFQVISVAVLGGLLWWHTPTSHIQDRVSISSTFQ